MKHTPLSVLVPVLVGLAAFAGGPILSASGGVGIYGILEKVVFEPNDQTPERAQLWGVFAYVDGGADSSGAVSNPSRGYLYFSLPPQPDQVAATKREWMDLKSVAGTGQAVGFGTWGYVGQFGAMNPIFVEVAPGRGNAIDLRVRPASEPPAGPVVYRTNVGVVKLPAQGSRADIVKRLQALVPKH